MKGKALLIGLNYGHCKSGTLDGCINDIENVSQYLQTKFNFVVKMLRDDTDLFGTSKLGIVTNLYQLALDSHSEDLDYVWIHYSGHGTWIKDKRRRRGSKQRDSRIWLRE